MQFRRASLLIVALVFFALPASGTAQAPRRASSPLQGATRALIEGRYDEVDALADKLDARDPHVVALKARAAIERGRYAQAEAMLRPVAARLPTSEAALELGLLQKMLGRPDATALLNKVAAIAGRSNDPADIPRGPRAAGAAGGGARQTRARDQSLVGRRSPVCRRTSGG